MWDVVKNSRFLSTGHRIQPSCGCKARETMVLNTNLFLKEPHQLTNFTWLVCLNNIWRRTFHFKGRIALFLGLLTLWPYSLTKPV